MRARSTVAVARRRPGRVAFALALAVITAVCALVALYWHSASRRVKADEAPVPVQIDRATVRNMPIWIDAIGNVQPLNTVNVKVRVDGELTQVLFKEGQLVHAGEMLARVDPRPYQAQLMQAQAAKARDQAQLASVMVDLDRATQLAQAGAGPSQAVDTLRAQAATLRATILGDLAGIDAAQLQLEFTKITSPIAGRAGQRLVDAGSVVHASDASGLVTITQIDPISIQFAVSQDDLPAIMAANAVQPLQVVAYTRDGTREIASGHLAFIDSQVSASSGQIQLKANFENSAGALWPGALVSVRLLEGSHDQSTVVPVRAVQRGQEGEYVYTVAQDMTVRPTLVETAERVDGMVRVTKGLSPGDKIVTAGQYRLARGVTVVNAAPPTQASATMGRRP